MPLPIHWEQLTDRAASMPPSMQSFMPAVKEAVDARRNLQALRLHFSLER